MPANKDINVNFKVKDNGTIVIKKANKKIIRGFKDIEKSSKKTTKSLEKQWKGVGRQLAAIAATVGGLQLAKSFIDTASAMENMRVRLEVLTGSVEEGNQLFQDMRDYASQVPFEFESIMAAATNLSGVLGGSVSEVNEWIPLIGDLAAATGFTIEEATSQISRMLSAGAQSAEMFKERGVLAMLGFTTGVSYSVEETRKKLMEAWTGPESNFRGATERMANTWTGLMSMLADAWTEFQMILMDAGIFDALKDVVREVTEQFRQWVEENKDLITQRIPEYIDKIKTSVKSIYDLYQNNEYLMKYGLVGVLLFGISGWAGLFVALGYTQDRINELKKEIDEYAEAKQRLFNEDDLINMGSGNQITSAIQIMQAQMEDIEEQFGKNEDASKEFYEDELKRIALVQDKLQDFLLVYNKIIEKKSDPLYEDWVYEAWEKLFGFKMEGDKQRDQAEVLKEIISSYQNWLDMSYLMSDQYKLQLEYMDLQKDKHDKFVDAVKKGYDRLQSAGQDTSPLSSGDDAAFAEERMQAWIEANNAIVEAEKELSYMIMDIQGQSKEAALARLREEYLEKKKLLGDSIILYEWYQLSKNEIEEQYAQESIDNMRAEYSKKKDIVENSLSNMASALRSGYSAQHSILADAIDARIELLKHEEEYMTNQDFYDSNVQAYAAYQLQLTAIQRRETEARILLEGSWFENFQLGIQQANATLETHAQIWQEIGNQIADVLASQMTDALWEFLESNEYTWENASAMIVDFAKNITKWIFEMYVKWLLLQALQLGSGMDYNNAATLGAIAAEIAAVEALTAAYYSLAAAKLAAGASTGGGGGGGTGGGMAEGGPMVAGTTYLVGEEGPELFTPNKSGYLYNNDELNDMTGPSGGSNIEINIANIVSDRQLNEYMSSKSGQTAVLNALGQNPKRARMVLRS